MRSLRFLPIRLIAFLFAMMLGGNLFAEADTNRHVILITIDGLGADYLTDPQASLPTLRRLAREGASAEALRVSNPSVTWPNHTTLVTGVHPEKHGVLFNGRLLRSTSGQSVTLDGERDKTDLVAVPTVYDVLHAAGYRTANINWPCTRAAETLDDNFPDVPNPLKHTTTRLRLEMIQQGILRDGEELTFRRQSAAARDQVWTDAAVHLIQARRPNFLLFHLLTTDGLQHLHGPRAAAAYTAIALADAHLAAILRAVTAAGLRERTTLIVVSDHGFERPTKLISPNVLFRKANLARPAPRRRAQSFSEGGTAFVYLNAPETAKEDRAQVIELLRVHEGIADIITPDRYPALHLPHPEKNPQMGDLVLVAKEGYAFSNEAFEEESITEIKFPAGSHGYLASNPKMNGVFVAWGRGIKPGTQLGIVDNIDVAPTIAALFGEKLPMADGKVLREILVNPSENQNGQRFGETQKAP